MPAKTPDRLLTVFGRTKDAVNFLLTNPNYEPPAHAYLVGKLGRVTGVKTKGCSGCPLYCIGHNSDDNTKFWRPTPMARSAKFRAGNRVNLAIDCPSDSFSSRHDEMEHINDCVLSCDGALIDSNPNPKIREDIRMAAHHGDHPHLAALFVQCKRTTEQQADAKHAFMASRLSGPPPSPTPSAAASIDRYFPVESAAADHEHTCRTNDSSFS